MSFLRQRQWDKMRILLNHAYQSVPYYRQQMDKVGLKPDDIRCREDWSHLPLLSKNDLRHHLEELVSTDYASKHLYQTSSGGSTGEPVRFYLDERRRRMAGTETHWIHTWCGWREGEPIARLWGAPEKTVHVSGIRHFFRRLILEPGFLIDAYSLNQATLNNFVDAYRRWSPTLVIGYAQALGELANFLLEEKIELPSCRAVVSSAELLNQHNAELIRRAFKAPLMDRYGCREVSLIACQCPQAQKDYHINMFRIFLELLDDDNQPVEPGASGRVVVTDLANFGMPLIRYDLGDRAKWSSSPGCVCGWDSERLSNLEGRTCDFLFRSDGTKIHGLYINVLVWEVPQIVRYRLCQESLEQVVLDYIENEPVPAAKLLWLQARLRETLGQQMDITLRKVETLPKSKSGKHQYIDCHIDPAEAPATPSRKQN
ncbi:MAG: phenylacetate--CoA ligase family protein [Sedimentisphaerales bacterium]|nr:phenylacetate--CoA ligase family protein [Sedimentisphaerales bacterium]